MRHLKLFKTLKCDRMSAAVERIDLCECSNSCVSEEMEAVSLKLILLPVDSQHAPIWNLTEKERSSTFDVWQTLLKSAILLHKQGFVDSQISSVHCRLQCSVVLT